MSDFLNRSFTRREKLILLALLLAVLVALYFLVVHYPIVNRMEQIEHESEEVDKRLSEAAVKAAEYSNMKMELDRILARPQDQISVMPAYSNIETLMRKLDVIFAGTGPDFSFGQASVRDNVAARSISFTCTAESYQDARRLLRDVTGTGWRCLLNSFTMTPLEESLYGGRLRVSGVVTFYEYVRADGTAEN